MKTELIVTKDGSHSLFVPELNEHYHSIHGAIQESIHVYINAGLQNFNSLYSKKEISIFEVGLGTGLNCVLTFLEAEKLDLKVNYTAIEAFPVDPQLIHQLNYTQSIHSKNNTVSVFQAIHSSEWNKPIHLSDHFILHKIYDKLENSTWNKNIDIIYFDAFAPTVQPELWTENIFSKLFSYLNAGGILVTYCAKGEVKRTLKKSGFTIEAIPGPPGKREMVRATK